MTDDDESGTKGNKTEDKRDAERRGGGRRMRERNSEQIRAVIRNELADQVAGLRRCRIRLLLHGL